MSLFITMCYLFSIFMFLNVVSILSFWLLLEINLIFFILLCLETKDSVLVKQETYQLCIFYFIVQSFSSVLILLFSIFFSSSLSEICSISVLLSIVLKSGLFPFQFWVYKMSAFFGELPLAFLLTFQKIPVFLFIFNLDESMVLYFSLLNLVAGAFFLYGSSGMVGLIVSSSIFSTMWFYLSYMVSTLYFSFFFCAYTVATFLICAEMSSYKTSLKTKSFIFSWIMFFLMGLPPLSLFFFKFYILHFFYSYSSYLLLNLLWGTSFLALVGYFIFLQNSLILLESIMNSVVYKSNFLVYFLTCSFFFFVF